MLYSYQVQHGNISIMPQTCFCLFDSLQCPLLPSRSDCDACRGDSAIRGISIQQHFRGSCDLKLLSQAGKGKLQLISMPIKGNATQAFGQAQPPPQELCDVLLKTCPPLFPSSGPGTLVGLKTIFAPVKSLSSPCRSQQHPATDVAVTDRLYI